jgi:6-phosphogluconolactonase (cycloisomerase 2 family)
VLEAKKMFISFASKRNKKNVYFVSLLSEMKKSEAKRKNQKRNKKLLEANPNENTVYGFQKEAK